MRMRNDSSDLITKLKSKASKRRRETSTVEHRPFFQWENALCVGIGLGDAAKVLWDSPPPPPVPSGRRGRPNPRFAKQTRILRHPDPLRPRDLYQVVTPSCWKPTEIFLSLDATLTLWPHRSSVLRIAEEIISR